MPLGNRGGYGGSQLTLVYPMNLARCFQLLRKPLPGLHGLPWVGGVRELHSTAIAVRLVILKGGDVGPLASREAVRVPLAIDYLSQPRTGFHLHALVTSDLSDGSAATLFALGP